MMEMGRKGKGTEGRRLGASRWGGREEEQGRKVRRGRWGGIGEVGRKKGRNGVGDKEKL